MLSKYEKPDGFIVPTAQTERRTIHHETEVVHAAKVTVYNIHAHKCTGMNTNKVLAWNGNKTYIYMHKL